MYSHTVEWNEKDYANVPTQFSGICFTVDANIICITIQSLGAVRLILRFKKAGLRFKLMHLFSKFQHIYSPNCLPYVESHLLSSSLTRFVTSFKNYYIISD